MASLILITMGFWIEALFSLITPAEIFLPSELLVMTFSLPGVVLNISVVPYLVASITSYPIEGGFKLGLNIWIFILIVAGLLYPLLPNPSPAITVMNAQLIITIAGALLFLALKLKYIPNPCWRAGSRAFLIISLVFLFLLITDILISRLSVNVLTSIDNISLPIYIMTLNIGSFFFAEKNLNGAPLVHNGILTTECRTLYNLTQRESELIQHLFDGKTNQELAETLYISKKTVENHLYNIYQKMGVKNRVQLIGTLQNWKQESRE